MGTLLGYIAGVLSTLLANYFSPPFRKTMDGLFAWFSYRVDPHRFDLNGKWIYKYHEPVSKDPDNRRETQEEVILMHRGRTVTGKGVTQDEDKRRFTYYCKVQHNLLFGSYIKEGEKGSIPGNGMVQVIISPDR